MPQWRDGYASPEILELDLEADGFPVQQRGVTNYAGLYFVGMPWLPTQKSGLLLGVGQSAEHIATQIAG